MPSHRWENYVLLRLLPTPYHRGAACETQQNLHRPVNKWPTSRNFTNNTTKDCYRLSNPILELARIVCTWTSFPQTVSKIMTGSVMREFVFHLSVFFFFFLIFSRIEKWIRDEQLENETKRGRQICLQFAINSFKGREKLIREKTDI